MWRRTCPQTSCAGCLRRLLCHVIPLLGTCPHRTDRIMSFVGMCDLSEPRRVRFVLSGIQQLRGFSNFQHRLAQDQGPAGQLSIIRSAFTFSHDRRQRQLPNGKNSPKILDMKFNLRPDLIHASGRSEGCPGGHLHPSRRPCAH